MGNTETGTKKAELVADLLDEVYGVMARHMMKENLKTQDVTPAQAIEIFARVDAIAELITHVIEYNRDDRFVYILRLWNGENYDELDVGRHKSEYRAWQQFTAMQADENSVINSGDEWTNYDIVRLDTNTGEEEVVDGGDL